ncbi:MAG: phosphonate C-P lyase system protein PhnH [Synergistaceae bacterium]|jgi:phosphonate C-P lyase system protein PhnH|nr:phosphonate C-P lyase system protein PhnH [Synergistaceae bacterium]
MRAKHDFDMVMGAQAVFRLLLDSLANPGRQAGIARYEGQFKRCGRWLAPAITLLDNETGFYWNGDPDVADEICFLTGSSLASLDRADFVFLPEPADPGEILRSVKPGSDEDPHDSAMIIAGTGGRPGANATLRGPGIPPEGRDVPFSTAERAWLEARDEQGYEYPCGVELVFFRDGGEILSVTRKVAIRWAM